MLPVETLLQLLRYEPETGKLIWLTRPRSFFSTDGECKRWNGRYAGKEAFTVSSYGYLDGYVLRKMHRAHRVAWLMHYGSEPNGSIDHINGNRQDNRVNNLRVVTACENARNSAPKSTNTSGVIGVSPFKGRWRATITANGKQIHLGIFADLATAAAVRKAAEIAHGYHPNHGRAA